MIRLDVRRRGHVGKDVRHAMLIHLLHWFTHPTFNRVMLMVLSAVLAVFSVFWGPGMLAGIMMFDAPDSSKRLLPWAVLITTFLWPWVMLAGVIMAFVFLAHGKVILAYVSIGIPLAPCVFVATILMRPRRRLQRADDGRGTAIDEDGVNGEEGAA